VSNFVCIHALPYNNPENTMKHTHCAVLLALAALAGCSGEETADTDTDIDSGTPTDFEWPSGVEQVTLDLSTVNAGTVEQRSNSTLPVTALGSTVVCDDPDGNQRFIARTFSLTNTTGRTLSQLQVHAITQDGHVGGTAFKLASAFGGIDPSLMRQALPRHGMRCETGSRPKPDPLRADLQLYRAEDLAATAQQVPALPDGVLPLGYGFLAQQRAGDANADNDSGTIGPGERAQFTVAYKVPRGGQQLYELKASFVLYGSSLGKSLVQTPEDQREGTTAGINTLPADTARISVLGGPACGLSGRNRFQTSVVIARTGGQYVTDSELDAPTPFSTIVSAATNGPGSLHEAVENAPAGASLCFTQDIKAIGLTVERDLTLMGGEGAALSGQYSFQVLHIRSGRFNLYGFRIYNGLGAYGGGILNEGTLTLRGMQIDSNIARSAGEARGGGIFSSGPLFLYNTAVQQNLAEGESGSLNDTAQYAASGGEAFGGGIYLDNAPLLLSDSLVTNNMARGGSGASGRDGVEEIQGTEEYYAYCSVIPTDGGHGGNAEGGGVYKRQGATVTNPGLVFGNSTVGGYPGSGGNVPGACSVYQANLGSFGNAGLENIAP